MKYLFFHKLGWVTASVLVATTAYWMFQVFKTVEGQYFPVVTDFAIEHTTFNDDSVMLSGTMVKVRDCAFISVVAYDVSTTPHRKLVVKFQGETKADESSRVVGAQQWNEWILKPKSKNLEIFSRHQCATGEVLTRLFSGSI